MNENSMTRLYRESRDFFLRNGLATLADALPLEMTLDDDQLSAVESAQNDGLSEVFLFPPVADQVIHTEDMIAKLAGTPLQGLDVDNQYTQPWVQDLDRLKGSAPENRPGGNGYLLFYSPEGVDQDTRGLNALELSIYLKGAKRRSMTVPEYLVLQRRSVEIFKDHRFDSYGSNVTSQWMCLSDHQSDNAVAMAYWTPGRQQQVQIGWCAPDDGYPNMGAHKTMVVPV